MRRLRVAPVVGRAFRVGPRILAVMAAMVVAGCVHRAPTGLPPATADELLAQLAARRAAVTSMRARARLRAGLAGVVVHEAVLVRRPDDVRVDVFSPAGLAYALGTDGSVLWAYPPSERTRYEGPATPANIARLFGAPIALADVVDVLLGLPPARRLAGPARLEVTPDHEYRVTLPLDAGEQDVFFAGNPLTVRRAEERRAHGPTLRVRFDDYADGFPHTIEVESPATGATVKLAYAAVEPNVALDPALFAPPPATRVLPLEAAAAVR